MHAATTWSDIETRSATKADPMAARYRAIATSPLTSAPTGDASSDWRPCRRITAYWRMVSTGAATRKMSPKSTVGQVDDGCSAVHAVENGTNGSPNNRCVLTQRITPLTCLTVCSLWW